MTELSNRESGPIKRAVMRGTDGILRVLEAAAPDNPRYAPFFNRNFRTLLRAFYSFFAVIGAYALWQIVTDAPRSPKWVDYIFVPLFSVTLWLYFGALQARMKLIRAPEKQKQQNDFHASPKQQAKLARRAARAK
jgi:hypothetical protein